MGMIGNTLAQGLISGANIVDGTVDTPDIKDSAVTAAKIATGVVTPGKLSTGAPTWDSDGKFGIGSTSPTQRLVVQDTSTVHTAVNITNGSGNYNIGVTGPSNTWGAAAGALVLRDSSVGATRMVIDSSGSVGVGTTSPSYRLDVNRGSNGFNARFGNGTNYLYTYSDGSGNYLTSDTSVNTAIFMSPTASGVMTFLTANTERARIDSSGRFFVGSGFSGITNTGSLTNPTILASGSIEFNYDGVSGTQRHGRIMGNGTTGGGAYGGGIDLEYYAYDGSTYRWYTGVRLDSSGNLLVGTTSSEAKLTVAGNIRMPWGANRSLTIGTSSNWGYVFSGESNELYIRDLDANFNFLHASYNSGTKFIEFAGTTLRVFSGSAQVNGSLSKSSGSFRIDHPIPEMSDTHHLVHSFVEAPQADNIYRGKATLVGGAATVNIDEIAGMTDGTFVLLNREVQCFTTNETGWVHVRGSVTGNVLTIEAQDNTCTDTISWMVIGERRDKHMYDTEWTDENGKVIVEPLKEVVPEPEQPVEEAA